MKKTSFSCQRDGLTIRGYVFGEPEIGRSAVIISHGFLANQRTVRQYAVALAKEGYLAITYDFNGGGIGSKSDGRSVDMTLMTERSDLLEVVKAVQTQFHPASISLMGCSQGGFVSALAAKEIQNSICRLILFYPALCIPDDARKGRMMFYRFDPKHVPNVLGRFPMKLGGDYARAVMDINPFVEIQGFEGPVLLVHGTADKIVNVSYSRKARARFLSCEYHEITGGGHGFKGAYDREAIRILLDFMNRQEENA